MTQKITLAQKYGLDDNDLKTLFVIRKNGVKKNTLKTYSKAIQRFLNAPESQGFGSAMDSRVDMHPSFTILGDFEKWRNYYFTGAHHTIITPTKAGEAYLFNGREYTVRAFTPGYGWNSNKGGEEYETLQECINEHPDAVLYGVLNVENNGISDVSDCQLVK